VDLVATSETTTTVSINRLTNHLNDRALDELVTELQSQCMVKVYSDCACINLVGSSVRTALAMMKSTMRFFDDHPLLMLSQSANDLCLSLLIGTRDHEVLLQQMHAMLIPAGTDARAGVFGARWMDIVKQT
jgi:aspartokinase